MMAMGVSCSKSVYRTEEGIVWNTGYHIVYNSDKDLSDSIHVIFNRIDESLSPFNASSVVTSINENRETDTDPYFEAVYAESVRFNRLTGGMFDPTVAPLIRAWGFGQGHEISRDTLRVDSLLQFVGIGKTRIQDRKLIKDSPEIEFNFSALAKGYGVDLIAEMLERNGVSDYLVEVGGEIRAEGANREGKKWVVGIDRPEAGANPGDIVSTISVSGCGIATSGNYRNFHEDNGKRFGHTISPLTGRPVATDVISATVVAPTCMEADAMATGCMALGSKRALELCDSLNFGVMMILSDFSVVTNSLFPN